jgi:hypothetical protein
LNNEATIEVLVSRVFQSRNIAHIEHWQTKSYAAHVALGAFYNDIADAIDAVIENYQGMFGKITVANIQMPLIPVPDIVAYLSDEMDWLETNIDQIAQGSQSIGNLIQTLVSVYSLCVYKLGMK